MVHTPTDEEGPILGDEDYFPEEDDEPYPTFSTAEITDEDLKGEPSFLVGGCSSAEQGPSLIAEEHKDELQVTSVVKVEEEDEEEDIAPEEDDELTTQSNESVTDLVQETEPSPLERPLEQQALITAVTTTETISTVSSTAAPTKNGKKKGPAQAMNRGVKALAKLKLSRRSSSNSSPSPSTPSSPPSSPQLLGRITSRFSKITRTKEASAATSSSSLTSKIESSKVGSVPSPTATAPVAIVANDADKKVSGKQDFQIDFHETVMMDHDEQEQAPMLLTEEPSELQLPGAQPVAIPGQSSVTSDPWAQSPTLHHPSTAGSGQTLVKLGRSSTVGSTVESETGSLKSSGSGRDAKDPIAPQLEEPKRKGSMMKKFSNLIKNERRKSSSDSNLSKRFSRRGSATMQSPVQVEENKVN